VVVQRFIAATARLYAYQKYQESLLPHATPQQLWVLLNSFTPGIREFDANILGIGLTGKALTDAQNLVAVDSARIAGTQRRDPQSVGANTSAAAKLLDAIRVEIGAGSFQNPCPGLNGC
jgi:hypothetical protein